MKKILSVFVILVILSSCGIGEKLKTTDAEQKNKTENAVATPSPSPSATPAHEEKKPSPSPSVTPVPDKNDSTASLSNSLNGWGYRKISGARPEFTAGQIALMDKYDCIYMGNDTEKKVYLTFDEGYENGYTSDILDTLKETKVKAAFFITGPYFNQNTDLVDRMVAEGHIVGNHSVNHPSLPSLSDEQLEEELLALDRQFYSRYGKSMKYLRPPKGEYSERTLHLSRELGYINTFWSFAYKDWETNNQKGADYAYEQVMSGIHNGIVILLHAVSKDNTKALGRIINDVKAAGYTFEALDEYTK